MTDITGISRMLADRAQSVAEYLLPGGIKETSEWRAGSVAGDKGQSLGVHLTGDKAGIWSDFATNEGGDLLDLWCAARRVPLNEALIQAREWLGIERPEFHRDPRPAYTRPPKPDCRKPQGPVYAYLTEDRNIPEEILVRYKIAEAGSSIVFPFLLPGGELAMAKVRPAMAGGKPKPTAAGCEPVLFGWQVVRDDARRMIITEGEIDAMSMAAYSNIPALSVPFGGGGGKKQQWIENDFDRLERFEAIYLALDMDEQGDAAAVEIASRLGRHRCLRVRLPHKDASECLMSGISTAEIRRCLETAENLDPEGLRHPSAYMDNVIRLFWPTEGDHVGYSLPYAALHDKMLFRPAELTLWSGASGSGKSQIISDCIPKWIQEGSRVCVASLEMKPQWTLKRMVKQTAGVDRATEPCIRDCLTWLDAGLLLYEHVGKASISNLLEVFGYARAKYGADQFVVDSLMRLGIAGDDYTGQEKAVYQLVDWCMANNVHVHLVAHSRKGERDAGPPATEDIKGAMEIGANAYNILTIWRDRKHEELIKAAKDDAVRQALEDEKAPVILNVAKQRNGDYEGRVRLWFNQQTYQYHSATDNRLYPRKYLTKPAEQPEIFEDFAS